MSIIRGFISNGLANVVQKIVRIADQLLLVPFFLTHWGAAVYGEWLTLTIIPSVLAFSDLGFGSAVCNSFVLAYAAGDKQKAADLRKSGFWIITLTIILGLLLTVVAMIVGTKMHLFEKSQIQALDAMIAVVCMMVARLLTFYTQLVEGFFRGARKAALGSLFGTNVSSRECWCSGALVVLGLFLYFVLAHLFAVSPTYSPIDALWGVCLCGMVCALSHGLVGWSAGEHWMNTLRYGALILLATQNYIIGVTKVLLDKITQEPDFLAHHFALKPIVLLLVYLVTLPIIHSICRHCPQILGRSGAAKR